MIRTLILLVIVMTASSAHAVMDIGVGAYGGMTIPVVNQDVEIGPLYGVQARVSVLSFLAVGIHFQSTSFGNPDEVFFEGTPNEFTAEKDGGSVKTFGGDVYLGGAGGTPGFNFFLVGSIGSYSWSRENQEDITKASFKLGPGAEIVMPGGLGFEARGLFEVSPKGDDGSWKNAQWFVGVNYHFGLGN